MPRAVILGGGFAGRSAARELLRRRKKVRDLEVVLVDRHNFTLFTPMLPEAASGAVEAQHITQPFRIGLRGVNFELGEILSIDESRRTVSLRHPVTEQTRSIAYDELLVALGSTPSSMGIQGVERVAYPLASLSDARRLRAAVIGAIEVASITRDVVERDRLLRFVVVGGGFTGVEAAGELSAFVDKTLKFYPSIDRRAVHFVLIQSEKRLLPHLPRRFGTFAARSLRERGVEIDVGKDVESVDDAGVFLKCGTRYESRTIVWSAGSHAAPFVKRLGVKLSKHGAIETRPDLSVPEHPHLWAIGDCAAVPKRAGGTYAPLAQNAAREGPLAARNVLAALRGRSTKPMRYVERGQMASLGDRQALAKLPGNAMLTGTAAWLLWRSYYLGTMAGARRRTRVVLDWTLGDVFGPPLSRLPALENGESSFENVHATRR